MLASLFQAILLGAVQGITEFLPISSTAHLILLEKLFKLNQEVYGLSFDMFTNIGTTAALVLFFWPDLKDIFSRWRFPNKRRPLSSEEKLPWQIFFVTFVVGLAGLILEDRIESQFRTLDIISVSLILVGVLMLKAENLALKRTAAKNSVGKDKPWQIYLVGLSQIIAFFPGISRSGITISTGMLTGLDRRKAAYISFLMSIPITVAAIFKRMLTFAGDMGKTGLSFEVALFYLGGAITAGFVGYLVIKYFMKLVSRSSLAAFAYYRFALASIILIYLIRTTT